MKEQTYKYSTYIEWGLTRREDGKYHPYEECIITKIPADDPCIQFDVDNYVSHGGSEGMEFTIHDTLKDAIIRSHYDIGAIRFVDIEPQEVTAVLTEILKEGNTQYSKDSEVRVAIIPIINEPPEEEVK